MSAREFIEQQKKLYKTLKPCYCLAIQETVHFNAEGIRHILYDKHRPRNIREKVYRAYLIDYLTEVIINAQKAIKETFIKPSCHLWILEWVTIQDKKNPSQKLKIKIVLRKRGNGNIFFWSVMRRGSNHKTKKPKP